LPLAISAATVTRLRSRGERSARSQTSPNSTSSVSCASFGAKSPTSFCAAVDSFGSAISFLLFVLVRGVVRSATPRSTCSAIDHLLRTFGIARSLHRDCGDSALDLLEIVGYQRNVNGLEVFLKAMELRGAGDRHDPWLLREYPSQRDLCWRS